MYTQILVGFLIGFLIGVVSPCNNTLHLTPDNQVCADNACRDRKTFMTIKIGEKICFRDNKNEELQIHLKDVVYSRKYNRVYDTSEYDIQVKTDPVCGLQDLCSPETCYLRSRFGRFEDKKNVTFQGYSCETSDGFSGCNSRIACTHFHWWLESTGSLAKVYKFAEEEGIAMLEIKYKTMVKPIRLTVNEPSFNLDNLNIGKIDTMSMVLHSFMGDMKPLSKYVLQDGMYFYEVEASQMNFPETSMIGDYQFSIEGSNDSAFNEYTVKCETDWYNLFCQSPPSALHRFRKMDKEYLKLDPNYVEANGEDSVEVMKPTKAHFNLLISHEQCCTRYLHLFFHNSSSFN